LRSSGSDQLQKQPESKSIAVFEISLIFAFWQPTPSPAGRREPAPALPISAAIPRLLRPLPEPRRQEREWPARRDPNPAMSVFFPFDPRDLVVDGQGEARHDRRRR
jgi:hypothetical protein